MNHLSVFNIICIFGAIVLYGMLMMVLGNIIRDSIKKKDEGLTLLMIVLSLGLALSVGRVLVWWISP